MDFNRVAKLRNSRISSRLSTAIFFMLGVSAMALFAQTSEQQEDRFRSSFGGDAREQPSLPDSDCR